MGKNRKRQRVYGPGGAPEVMHHPAALEVASTPEKWGKRAHAASRPHAAAAMAPVQYCEARDLLWIKFLCGLRGIITCYRSRRYLYVRTQFDLGRPAAPRVWLRWCKLHWLPSSAFWSCISCSLSTGCLVCCFGNCGIETIELLTEYDTKNARSYKPSWSTVLTSTWYLVVSV